MRRTILAGLLVALSVCVLAENKIQPLNIKTGLWESTTSFIMSGTPPIPAEVLAKLTPEQRARMEERMKASNGDKAQTTTDRSCLTKEKLDEDYLALGKKQDCTQNVVTATSSKAEVRFTCQHDNVKLSGIIRVEALNTENVKGSGDTSASDGEHTMKGTTTFTSKWLGADCGDVK